MDFCVSLITNTCLSKKEEIFRALKEKLQVPQRPSWSFLEQGMLVPQGSVVEVVGSARFEFIVQFICGQPDFNVAWVEPELTLFPPAVAQRGVDITRWLLVEAGESALWAVEELLHSHFFDVVIVPDLRLSMAHWRRLQLECERSGQSVMLLSEVFHENVNSLFVIEAQWQKKENRKREDLQDGGTTTKEILAGDRLRVPIQGGAPFPSQRESSENRVRSGSQWAKGWEIHAQWRKCRQVLNKDLCG